MSMIPEDIKLAAVKLRESVNRRHAELLEAIDRLERGYDGIVEGTSLDAKSGLSESVYATDAAAIRFGSLLPERFRFQTMVDAGASIKQAQSFRVTWKRVGWVRSVSRGILERTETFGGRGAFQRDQNEPIVTRKLMPDGRPVPVKKLKEVTAPVPPKPLKPEPTPLAMPMIGMVRKLVMGMGPNAEFSRRQITETLRCHVNPWTYAHIKVLKAALDKLCSGGELTQRHSGKHAVFKIANLKPVAADTADLGKVSSKEEEWRKLREAVSVPRDILEDVGVER